jgi:hypothetical protein
MVGGAISSEDNAQLIYSQDFIPAIAIIMKLWQRNDDKTDAEPRGVGAMAEE